MINKKMMNFYKDIVQKTDEVDLRESICSSFIYATDGG